MKNPFAANSEANEPAGYLVSLLFAAAAIGAVAILAVGTYMSPQELNASAMTRSVFAQLIN